VPSARSSKSQQHEALKQHAAEIDSPVLIPEGSPIAENAKRHEALADVDNPMHGYYQLELVEGRVTALLNWFNSDRDLDLVAMKKEAAAIAGGAQKFMIWIDRMYWNANQEYM